MTLYAMNLKTDMWENINNKYATKDEIGLAFQELYNNVVLQETPTMKSNSMIVGTDSDIELTFPSLSGTLALTSNIMIEHLYDLSTKIPSSNNLHPNSGKMMLYERHKADGSAGFFILSIFGVWKPYGTDYGGTNRYRISQQILPYQGITINSSNGYYAQYTTGYGGGASTTSDIPYQESYIQFQPTYTYLYARLPPNEYCPLKFTFIIPYIPTLSSYVSSGSMIF